MAAPTTRRTALQILAAISVATIPSAAKAASDGDVRLHALVDEMLAINKAENALIDANPDVFYSDDIPGYRDHESRHFEIIGLISATEAVGVEGLRAKARALQFCGVSDDSEATRAIAGSLAGDILRLYPLEVA